METSTEINQPQAIKIEPVYYGKEFKTEIKPISEAGFLPILTYPKPEAPYIAPKLPQHILDYLRQNSR